MDGGIGYCRIASFQERTSDDLKKAIQEMGAKANPLKGIVLDLRNNPGGILSASVDVAGLFLDGGNVVYTEGRLENSDTSFDADPLDITNGVPLVVLINQGSASSSEILSGALKDHHLATLVGERTFGKGSVQTIRKLSDGSALHITIARWYTMYATILQSRNWLPDEIGGIAWIAMDNVATSIYIPVYCSATDLPESYKTDGRRTGFSYASAWWVFNRLGTLAAQRWGDMRHDVRAVWDPWQEELFSSQQAFEQEDGRIGFGAFLA